MNGDVICIYVAIFVWIQIQFQSIYDRVSDVKTLLSQV